MRKLMTLLVGASALAMATPANAATFIFSSGNYIPGVTAPEPLLSPDILELTTGNNRFFSGGVTLTNQSGTVNWNAGNIFLAGASVIDNHSLWDAKGDNSINPNGGLTSSFLNSGIFRKSAGAGATTIAGIAFANSGTIDAQIGSITFSGGNATFNNGSIFSGAGEVNITNNAAFNGGFTSSNVDFQSGTYTGNGASLSGTADWTAGTFTGDWTVTTAATLNAVTGNNKFLSGGAVVTNNGTVNWSAGNLFLAGASQIINNSTWNASGDNSINPNGGLASTFTNSGTFVKIGGTGATTIAGIAFVNNNNIEAQTGSIVFAGGNAMFNAGSSFFGAGDIDITNNAVFNGAFTSANLDFRGGTYTGTGAALTGSADWIAGTFTGDWTINSGSTVNAISGNNKFLNGGAIVTNDGTVNWVAGNIFLAGASQFVNNGLWDATGDNSLNPNGGGTSVFTNNGTFSKSGGAGATTVAGIGFVNNGTVNAQTAAITFSGGNATFNAGSIFLGAGEVNITNNATFNGGFTSSNLDFEGGTYTGNAAALTGTADWNAGTFTGDWMVNSGSSLNLLSGNNKFLSGGATLTNDGTFNWAAGNLFLAGASQIVNTGTVTITGDNSINNNGGLLSSVTNNGLIQKTSGSGTTILASGVGLDNNGTINVLSGTIALPAAFNNDGTLGGTGTFASTNLTNDGSIAPGALGATGTLALTGNFFQSANGFLNSQLASSGSSDLFNISGTAGISGTLALSCILGCAISTGDSFVLLDSIGALSGTFSNITTSGFRTGFSFDVVYDYGADLVRLNVLDAGLVGGGVPEPSTWAMMILGFGMVGHAMRKRSTTRASVLA